MDIAPLLKAAFNAFPNFVIIDDACRIAYMNQDYARLLGISVDEVLGKPVTQVIDNTKLPEVVKTGRAQIGAVMTFYNHASKQEVNLVCNRIPLLEGEKVIGAVAMTTFSEVTDIYALYEEVERMREQNKLYQEALKQLKKQIDPLDRIIGSSPEIMKTKKDVENFAKSNLAVLLTGETGVGKEVFANAIHELSSRSLNNFVKINCAAIPEDLLESELFGYETGAFTGALKHGKIGKFELADGGTLLLDEIGEMPLALQAKLLRVLQEKEVERVGGLVPKKVDIRLICSTNRNISELVKEKKFREDLYYRINTVELRIPPLRERLNDIDELGNFFLQKINKESGTHTLGIKPEVTELLKQYHWPGNVRELEHILERLSFMHQNSYITLEHCDFLLERMELKQETWEIEKPLLQQQREEAEKETILQALTQTNGNKTKAAQLLGIDRSMLYHKIKKYKL